MQYISKNFYITPKQAKKLTKVVKEWKKAEKITSESGVIRHLIENNL